MGSDCQKIIKDDVNKQNKESQQATLDKSERPFSEDLQHKETSHVKQNAM